MDRSEKNRLIATVEPDEVFPEAVIAGEKTFMSPDEIASYFLPGGMVEKTFGEGYEFRKQQQSLVREITSAFNGDSFSLLEAPTGIGKTLSYLLPAAKWALLNGEKVIVSTNTINLQDQIISKDIPLLSKVLGRKVEFALAKGMRNYLCLLRSDEVKGELPLPDPDAEDGVDEARAILDWAEKTEDGSVFDMGFTPSEQQWDRFAAESESCVRRECPHYNECFFFKARRKIAKADLIVVNHHLLFSDISIKHSAGRDDAGVLPPVGRVVIDEAHNVAGSATMHFTLKTSSLGVTKTLNRLKRVAARAARLAKNNIRAADARSRVMEILSAMQKVFPPRIKKVETASKRFFESLYNSFEESSPDGSYGFSIRVMDDEIESGGRWGKAVSLYPQVSESMADLSGEVRKALAVLDSEGGDETVGIVAELKAVFAGIDRHSAVIRGFAAGDSSQVNFVKSVEAGKRNRRKFASVSMSPIDIAPYLKERLYDRCKTLILTSATLREKDGFEFQKNSLGLRDNERITELAVPSPFDHKRQALLALPDDLPAPEATDVYSERLGRAIYDCVRASRGGALVLFTSYRLLKEVSVALAPELEGDGIRVLTQGDMPREKILAEFKADGNAVLFGTDSFREGVDIAGDALRLVVITGLPFSVPAEPVFQARMEAIKQSGKDAFNQYAVPVAVINFRQAFGRLIRTATDRGAVAVLDSRITRKHYGRHFINSIPQCGTLEGHFETVVRELKKFFDSI
ncbi:MAG: hypothetical protein GKS04_05270 [Candidatus Mycalebacterium zealandia]|nr:MAG: hypothetical protein GKS04_05270 [Candidatus Mycalebacterium zealandia]